MIEGLLQASQGSIMQFRDKVANILEGMALYQREEK